MAGWFGWLGRGALLSAGLLLAARPGLADPVEDFYAGRTIPVLIGFSAGGGYDIYGRTVARFMGRHLPGNPTLVPQNMPGAGSLKLVNYLYNVAPKDGGTIGIFAPGVVVEPLLGHAEGARFQAPKFSWLGSVSQEVSVCAFMTSSGITDWAAMKSKPALIGSSGAGAESDVFPTVLRNLFHLPFKIVTGYPGGNDMILAMQRHELDGRCGWSWTSLESRSKAMLDSQEIAVTLQIGLNKSPDLPDVPLVMDMTPDPQEKAALRLIVSRQSIARPFAAPPGIPADRLAALRAAFDATMKDPDFLAETKKLDLEVMPLDGAAVAALINEAYAAPPAVVTLATEAMKTKP